jgi:hypothetical protein
LSSAKSPWNERLSQLDPLSPIPIEESINRTLREQVGDSNGNRHLPTARNVQSGCKALSEENYKRAVIHMKKGQQ